MGVRRVKRVEMLNGTVVKEEEENTVTAYTYANAVEDGFPVQVPTELPFRFYTSSIEHGGYPMVILTVNRTMRSRITDNEEGFGLRLADLREIVRLADDEARDAKISQNS